MPDAKPNSRHSPAPRCHVVDAGDKTDWLVDGLYGLREEEFGTAGEANSG
jgi:hypothetical protein